MPMPLVGVNVPELATFRMAVAVRSGFSVSCGVLFERVEVTAWPEQAKSVSIGANIRIPSPIVRPGLCFIIRLYTEMGKETLAKDPGRSYARVLACLVWLFAPKPFLLAGNHPLVVTFEPFYRLHKGSVEFHCPHT